MGTTGYVRVVERGEVTAVFRTQFDGFPDQLGRQLVYGLHGKTISPGWYKPGDDMTKMIGDLAIEVASILNHYRGSMHVGLWEDGVNEGWGVYTVYRGDDGKPIIRHRVSPEEDDIRAAYEGPADPDMVPDSWKCKEFGEPDSFIKREEDRGQRMREIDGLRELAEGG